MFKCSRNKSTPTFARLLRALLVVAAGVLLMGFNMGWISAQYKPIVFSWPSGILLLGLLFFIHRARLLGAALMIAGSYLLLNRIGYIGPVLAVKQIVFPALLILLGIAMLVRNRQVLPLPNRSQRDGYIEEQNIFGGSRQQFRDEIFRGGSIQCLFGGSELDLSHTTLPEGTTILDVSLFFGGIVLTLPSSWNIQLQTQSLLGGFVEEDHPPRVLEDNSRILLIRGSCVIGGGEIRYRDPS